MHQVCTFSILDHHFEDVLAGAPGPDSTILSSVADHPMGSHYPPPAPASLLHSDHLEQLEQAFPPILNCVADHPMGSQDPSLAIRPPPPASQFQSDQLEIL